MASKVDLGISCNTFTKKINLISKYFFLQDWLPIPGWLAVQQDQEQLDARSQTVDVRRQHCKPDGTRPRADQIPSRTSSRKMKPSWRLVDAMKIYIESQ